MSQDETEIVVKLEPGNPEIAEDPLAVVPDYEAYKNNYETIQNNKLLDIQEMLVIASNILQSSKEEREFDQFTGLPINKLQYLTKQPLQYLDEVLKDEEYVNRSLKQVIIDTKPLPPTIIPFIYGDIREFFVNFYVKYKQIPTVTDLLKSLNEKREDSFYKNVKICTLVKNNLIKYHHLPKLNRYILCENPEFAYQRHLYLRQIIGYRARKKNIIYVTVLKINSAVNQTSFAVLAASPRVGLLAKSDAVSYIGTHDDEEGNDQVKLWMRFELLPKLSTNNIVVLIQPRKKDKTPTPFSTRHYMIDWLQKRGVPFDTETHKAQLYSLVKAFKEKKEQGFYEEILASGGLKVVVCPVEYHNLDFFDFHNIVTSVVGNVPAFLENIMKKLSYEEWNKIEQKIIEEEKQVMSDDEEMQRVVDNLLQMAKNGDLRQEDFPDGCCGTKADNFAVHIGDIIVD